MRDQSRVIALALASIQLSLLAASGCANMSRSPNAPGNAAGAGIDTITLTPTSESDPIRSLEKQLPKLRSERVVIPTALLRTLLATRKLTDGQCRDLTVQLEALKNIDLQETELGVEQP